MCLAIALISFAGSTLWRVVFLLQLCRMARAYHLKMPGLWGGKWFINPRMKK